MSQPNKQQGYILIILLLALISFSATAIYSTVSPQQLQHHALQQRVKILEQIKQNLIIHLQSTPEIYSTESNGTFYQLEAQTAPGYLPCPDTNNNGKTNTPCGTGGVEVVIGRLPATLATRHFRLVDHPGYHPFIWYIVDSRYVIQNANYHNQTISRFSPLNRENPGNGKIQLDQQTNLVALLIWSKNLNIPANAATESLANIHDLAQNHFKQHQDLVSTLSFTEWQQAVTERVALQKDTLCLFPANQPHWFNAYSNNPSSQSTEGTEPIDNPGLPHNLIGANWREYFC